MQTTTRPSHDELSELFQRNLSLDTHNPASANQQLHFNQPQAHAQTQPRIYYSSQHYTGTAHLRPSDYTSDPANTDISWQSTLLQHDIDPSLLLPSQALLYQNANYDQRLRLLELWRMAPHAYGDANLTHQMLITESRTSLTQGEDMAKVRYECRMQDREHQPPPKQTSSETEPYMASGYEVATQRVDTPHMDPVYAAATGLWQAPSHNVAVEDQYGAWEQARGLARLQNVHNDNQSKRSVDVYGINDEDMVM